MNPKMQGPVDLIFIRGGISAKTGNPYLSLSNGRKEFFVNIPKDLHVDDETFSRYSEDDSITVDVEVTVGSDNVKLLGIVENE
jgi:hypothetical protein